MGCLRVVKGAFTIKGKRPDGDSFASRPANPALFRRRVRETGVSEPRIEGIKAFGTSFRPSGNDGCGRSETRGLAAGDPLIELMCSGGTEFSTRGAALSSDEFRVPVIVRPKSADCHGHPVSDDFGDTTSRAKAELVWVHDLASADRLTTSSFVRTCAKRMLYDTIDTPAHGISRQLTRGERDTGRGFGFDDATASGVASQVNASPEDLARTCPDLVRQRIEKRVSHSDLSDFAESSRFAKGAYQMPARHFGSPEVIVARDTGMLGMTVQPEK